MEYRTLGRSGLQVSLAGMGCNNFGGKLDQAASTEIVNAALDEGITFFDTAAMYNDGHSEECLGAALGSRRGEVIIATKFAFPSPADVARAGFGASMGAASRDAIYKSVHGSLRRLGTDYIDVLFQHRPDKATPVEETLGALTDLVREGTVRYVGSSAFKGYQIADADWTAREGGQTRFIAAQNEWNMLSRGVETDVVPACEQFGLGMVPFFPLANGFLTGKYKRGAELPAESRLAEWKEFRDPQPEMLHAAHAKQATALTSEANFDVLEALTGYAEAHGHSMLELAMSWLASSATVASVIAGVTKVEYVATNSAAVESWKLDAEEMGEVDGILSNGA